MASGQGEYSASGSSSSTSAASNSAPTYVTGGGGAKTNWTVIAIAGVFALVLVAMILRPKKKR